MIRFFDSDPNTEMGDGDAGSYQYDSDSFEIEFSNDRATTDGEFADVEESAPSVKESAVAEEVREDSSSSELKEEECGESDIAEEIVSSVGEERAGFVVNELNLNSEAVPESADGSAESAALDAVKSSGEDDEPEEVSCWLYVVGWR